MIRVLIVDDSPTVRQILRYLLEQDPEIQVVGEAMDGAQAVEKVEQLEPDVITMDVQMPDMDGLEATRRIMALRPTPILIVTAHVDSSEMNIAFEAMKAGALDIMGKPGEFEESDLGDWGKDLKAKVMEISGIRPLPIGISGKEEGEQAP